MILLDIAVPDDLTEADGDPARVGSGLKELALLVTVVEAELVEVDPPPIMPVLVEAGLVDANRDEAERLMDGTERFE